MSRYSLGGIFAALLFAISIAFLPVFAFADDEGETAGESDYRIIALPVNTGVDNGYSEDNAITGDDPHFGWSLGYFFVTGQTQVTKDADGNPVILKNTGDKVTLWFHLNQDIDCLNGNEKLSIAQDTNGYDQRLSIEKTDFGRGALIIKYLDYRNMPMDPGMNIDYLAAKASPDSDTEVELFEEGDYEVALDYEIVKDDPFELFGLSLPFETPFEKSYNNYRISFKFSVRNADCVIYPRDAETNSELTTSSYTENGFYLDTAKSRYLEVNLKREVLSEGVDGTVLETKMNTRVDPGSGTKYTEEGIYTVTAKNPDTELETSKVIYVGTSSILKTCAETGKSVDEVLKQQAKERELEDEVYSKLVDDLASQGLYVENVQVSYLSKEYLENLDYNSRENIYFGYKLSDIAEVMGDSKYVFALDDNGKTVVREFSAYDDTMDKIVENVAIGGGVILVCVTVTAVTAGAGAPAAVTAVCAFATKGAIVGSVSGAAIGGTIAGVVTGIETGDTDKALKAALSQGSEDFKWGAIAGALASGSSKLVELNGIARSGLTLSEAAQLQKSNLPNAIIKNLHSMDEYKIYESAGLSAKRMANGEWAYVRKIDLTTEIDGMTNAERIRAGHSPLDSSGNAYELHHVGQNPDSPLAILTKSEHIQGGNNRVLHWRDDSEVEHGADWAKQVREFWTEYLRVAQKEGLS